VLVRLALPNATVYHAGEMHCHGGGGGGGGSGGCHGSQQWLRNRKREERVKGRANDDEMEGSQRLTGTSRCRARNSGLQHSSTASRGLARFSTKPVRTVASPVGLSFPVQIAFERAMRRRTVVKKSTSHSS
jgi:hypothetical protein